PPSPWQLFRWWVAASAIGLAVCAAGALLARTLLRSSSGPPAIAVGEPYAISVQSERATFDLDFVANARYLLVIGILGPAGRTFTIAAESKPISAVQIAPIDRLSRAPSPSPVHGPVSSGESVCHAHGSAWACLPATSTQGRGRGTLHPSLFSL